jgi:hypothetical protein
MEALEFESFAWLWALPAPLVLAWWLSRATGASVAPTGALEVWREVGAEAPRVARRSWRWSPRTAAAVASLVAAILALAGPFLVPREAPTMWSAIVDASPSMALPDAAGFPRGQRAAERAQRLLASVVAPGDEVEWRLVSGGRTLERASQPNPQWWSTQSARRGLARPDWARFDALGTLWVTDRGVGTSPRLAGLCASGGVAGRGAMASWPGARLAGDGETWAVEAAERSPRVNLAAAQRSSAIGRAVAAWASARGVELVEGYAPDEVELNIVFAPPERARPAVGARGGWRIEGAAGELGGAAALDETWARDATDPARVLVRASRGRVECAFAADHVVRGDSAAFAVAWAELLDAALLPIAPTAPVDAFTQASEALERAPQRPLDERRPARPFAHVLAVSAALLALLAAFLKR